MFVEKAKLSSKYLQVTCIWNEYLFNNKNGNRKEYHTDNTGLKEKNTVSD